MKKAQGIVDGVQRLLQWFAASNGRLAAAAVVLILMPQILAQGSNLLWNSLPLPKELPVDQVTRIQFAQSWWTIIFVMGGGLVAFLFGWVLLFSAGVRAWRDRRRRNP